MSKSNVVPRDIDREVEDLMAQLDTLSDETRMVGREQTVSDHLPFESTVDFISGVRQILERAELSMDAASAPGYESAPVPIKRVIKSLFDPEMRERLFDLILADSDEYSKKEELKNGLTYMQHMRGLPAR